MKVFYSQSFVASGYAFDTTRKAEWVADAISTGAMARLELVEPRSLDEALVINSHDPAYVAAVQTGIPRHLAESQGFSWDAGLWTAVAASNGGAVDAARAALEDGVAGSLSSGLHHARKGRGAGFCTLNGLIIAAREALKAGARAVLILDFDAHCGGGTSSMIDGNEPIWQFDVAVDGFDAYDSTHRATLQRVYESVGYLSAIERAMDAAERAGQRFDLCLYNAGMDPYEGCAIGGLYGITRDVLARRERMVFEWCRARRLPVAFVLAGGYIGPLLSKRELVDLHLLTLAAAIDCEVGDRQRF